MFGWFLLLVLTCFEFCFCCVICFSSFVGLYFVFGLWRCFNFDWVLFGVLGLSSGFCLAGWCCTLVWFDLLVVTLLTAFWFAWITLFLELLFVCMLECGYLDFVAFIVTIFDFLLVYFMLRFFVLLCCWVLSWFVGILGVTLDLLVVFACLLLDLLTI